MSSLSWWRSWHGAPTDHKWAVIAARSGAKVGVVSAVAWAMLDYASQHKDRGSVEGFDPEEYAVYSGFEEAQIIAIIKAMTDKKIIIDGRFANWEKRQPKREDDSTERVRNFRAMKRSVTQGNAPDKDTDTDTDEETETDQEGEEEAEPSPPSPFDKPEIDLVHEVTGLYPDIGREPVVVNNIQAGIKRLNHPPRAVVLENARKAWEHWCSCKTESGKPYNPGSWGWVEWFATGYMPTNNGSKPGEPKTLADAFLALMEDDSVK